MANHTGKSTKMMFGQPDGASKAAVEQLKRELRELKERVERLENGSN